MFSFILYVSVQTCAVPGYPRIVKSSDNGQSLVYNQVGATKFIQCGFKNVLLYAQMINLPDMHFSLNLGVTSIDFEIKDIHFKDLTVKDVQVDFSGQDVTSAGITGCTVVLTIQWSFKQQTYPYIQDNGEGTILIKNVELKVQVGSDCDYEHCPGHYKIFLQRADLQFEQLALQLSGGSSWIYQSLIDLVIESIQGTLAETLSAVILNQAVKVMNDVMNADGYNYTYVHKEEVVKDERVTNKWGSGFRYFSIDTSGYTYAKENLLDEYVTPDMLRPTTRNKFNEEITFILQEATFNNVFYIFHKYFDTYSTEQFKVTKTPKIKLVNTGVLLDVQVQVAETQETVDIQLFGELAWKSVTTHNNISKQNMTQVYFNFQNYQGTHQVIDSVIKHINEVQDYAAYQVFSPLMNVETFHAVVDVDEKAIRLFGLNAEKCPSVV
ncbi:Conserved_hypothetical protein [Hexamita inflata]|uniref:Lipid-binding serum glycoprotein N-terminal domain-containing protein n=1 Tax=Hexamita inflata TaxID=28002 RepID=A0AA86PU32_9EUKA|nr:Conserved hypothetical protein [Hexamita inflata]